jgi:hypothetical protein
LNHGWLDDRKPFLNSKGQLGKSLDFLFSSKGRRKRAVFFSPCPGYQSGRRFCFATEGEKCSRHNGRKFSLIF